jgi:hypothetical protein
VGGPAETRVDRKPDDGHNRTVRDPKVAMASSPGGIQSFFKVIRSIILLLYLLLVPSAFYSAYIKWPSSHLWNLLAKAKNVLDGGNNNATYVNFLTGSELRETWESCGSQIHGREMIRTNRSHPPHPVKIPVRKFP